MTNEDKSKLFNEACINFVMALCDSTKQDRDAIWEGVKAALATYTATDNYEMMQTMVERLRKWNEAASK